MDYSTEVFGKLVEKLGGVKEVYDKYFETVIKSIRADLGYEIDFNTAGMRKEYCLEPYPSGVFSELVDKYDIRKVYGSDSHVSTDVGRFFENY